MKDIKQVVKVLRLALGDTQQSFAHRLGVSISTAVRYELSRAPSGKALAMFERIARDTGNHLIAEEFRAALEAELGLKLQNAGMLETIYRDLVSLMPDRAQQIFTVFAVRIAERGTRGFNPEPTLSQQPPVSGPKSPASSGGESSMEEES